MSPKCEKVDKISSFWTFQAKYLADQQTKPRSAFLWQKFLWYCKTIKNVKFPRRLEKSFLLVKKGKVKIFGCLAVIRRPDVIDSESLAVLSPFFSGHKEREKIWKSAVWETQEPWTYTCPFRVNWEKMTIEVRNSPGKGTIDFFFTRNIFLPNQILDHNS